MWVSYFDKHYLTRQEGITDFQIKVNNALFRFLKYYHILSKQVRNFTYNVMERNHVEELLQTNQYFHGLNISVIYYSMSKTISI